MARKKLSKKQKKMIHKYRKPILCILLVIVLALAIVVAIKLIKPETMPFLDFIFRPDNSSEGTDDGGDLPPAATPGDIDLASALKVYFLDVGQGDSILLRFPDGTDMLVDAGSGTSVTAAFTTEYLNELSEIGLDSIDCMVATHPDSDHINMLDNVLATYEVKTIYYNGYIHTSKTFETLQEAILNETYDGEQSAVVTIDGDGDIYTLYDTDTYSIKMYACGYERFSDVNSMSPIIFVEYSGRKIVLTGDAEAETEQWFLQSVGTATTDCDVLKVGHHGSRTSSSAQFLDYIDCEYAVISCGTDNKYGHPHEETLTKLNARGCKLYNTEQNGTVTLYIDKDGDIAFECEKEADAEK